MAVLSVEEYRHVQEKIFKDVEPILVGRKLMPKWKLPTGVQEVGYDKLEEMSAAEIIGKFSTGSYDVVGKERIVKDIPILQKGFYMSYIDLEASRLYGEDLKTIGRARAARQVAVLEDDLIFKGDATYGIVGIDGVAANTKAASATWDTTGEPYNDCNDIVSMVEGDGFDVDWIVMHPTNLGEARKLITNTGATHLEKIKELVPNIYKSYRISEGTLYCGAKDEDVAQLAVADDMRLFDPNPPNVDKRVYDFEIIDRVVPLFYQHGATADKSDAFGKLTGI
jgi:uncharacterized linocin/CFP29 family protein